MKCLDFDWRIIEFMVYCLTYQFRKSMMASISNKNAPYHCGMKCPLSSRQWKKQNIQLGIPALLCSRAGISYAA